LSPYVMPDDMRSAVGAERALTRLTALSLVLYVSSTAV